ncbi:TAF6-containing protein [Cryptosporidium canis]|uniref:TAF6-containing protein n=1 Tax=Cryptosporidium canis TaxID=195482 RepID=A0ABQ8P9N2_9CRYT|nr:TAF6-containing protein [Cryptosporidium canis]
MMEETKATEYDQFSLNESSNSDIYGSNNSLIVRKKPKIDDELKANNFSFDTSDQNGIFSAYDFVYPVSKQLCCDQISTHAANLIVQAMEFKLRQIIEEAIKLAHHRGSCTSANVKNGRSSPFISLGDINSAMRYICGSNHLIWSSEKPPRNYFISASNKKDQVICETSAEIFHNLHERSIKYIPCFSFPNSSGKTPPKVNFTKDFNDSKEIFHDILRDLNCEKIVSSTINLHWLAVEGKFVFSPENDTKFIKSISSNIGAHPKLMNRQVISIENGNEHFDKFEVVISKAIEGFISEEQREFLSYMNRMFIRGMEELSSLSIYQSTCSSSSAQHKAKALKYFFDSYGLSERDIDTVTSVMSLCEGSTSLELHNYNNMDNEEDIQYSNSSDKHKTFSKEDQQKVELLLKLNDIFYILETNTDFEPLLPYLVYYFSYNTQVICQKFEKTGELPKIGSLQLLLRICRSVIRNPYCSNTTYYIHKIMESLIRIMVSCPSKEVISNLEMKTSTYYLIDNLNSRHEASKLLENILDLCNRNLPIGTAKILEHLCNDLQSLLDIRLNNFMSGNCLQIASIYGIVCGIRSLGDFSISNILFPKLLTIFQYSPEDRCSKISFLKLHLEISALIKKCVSLSNIKPEQKISYNLTDLNSIYWGKLIESLEKILGDGVIPVLLTSDIFIDEKDSEKLAQAICFLDQCIKTYYIDSNIKCQSSKGFPYITDKKRQSEQYIESFISSYKSNSKFKNDYNNPNNNSDLYYIKSMLDMTI